MRGFMAQEKTEEEKRKGRVGNPRANGAGKQCRRTTHRTKQDSWKLNRLEWK